MVSGRTGRIKTSGAVVGRAVVGADARIIDALLMVGGRVSAVLSFGLGAGGAGKDPYSCIMLSSVGEGVDRIEARTESGSMYALELGLSALEASNIFASRMIGRLTSSLAVAVGGVCMPYTDTECSESERSSLELSRSLGIERERLGRCHATELGGRHTTGDRGTGTEHDRVWLIASGCSDGEALTWMGFTFSMVCRRGFTGLTDVGLVGLTNG